MFSVSLAPSWIIFLSAGREHECHCLCQLTGEQNRGGREHKPRWLEHKSGFFLIFFGREHFASKLVFPKPKTTISGHVDKNQTKGLFFVATLV
jgi:hypothetical protein